jgi:hypothetical protein
MQDTLKLKQLAWLTNNGLKQADMLDGTGKPREQAKRDEIKV